MLSIFRNNQFTSGIPLAVYVALTHLSAYLGYVKMPLTDEGTAGLLYERTFGMAGWSPMVSAILASLLVYFQAILVNRLADEFRLMGERNWLPGLFYALVAAGLPEFLFFSPVLLAATFIPIAARRVMKCYKTMKAGSLILEASFWMALGSLMYPPAIWMLIALYAGINIMRSFNPKEQMVFITGAFIPIYLAWTGFFWLDEGGLFLHMQYGRLFDWYRFDMNPDKATIIKAILWSLMVIGIVLGYGPLSSKKVIQQQKCISVLFWLLFMAGVSFFLRRELFIIHLFLGVCSMSVFIAMLIGGIRRHLLAEIFHLILLGGVLWIQFFSAQL